MKYLFLLLLCASLSTYAQNDSWKKLAEKTVAFKNEKDKVTLVGSERDINKVKVKCTQGTLELKSITIVMDNGEKKEYDAKGLGVLTKGMSSVPYNVPSKGDKVKHLELEYDSKGAMLVTKKAKVEVWGKKDKK
ncbi:DUF2541 domain-containing protein [Aestuariibaculum sediminum]|uniref:DUF2541 domain-containing protein n=1 Tax=Aestuariibaculum sediminum TaxID=2770637 RepID=A0A8J6U8L9_9FLAO|nr:DUF2541 domain-containing protein [Aestuariibaculum sediminum]MBD0833445.1 DUF2541 domain-containing protein [Aestuariibaculum sediminum]